MRNLPAALLLLALFSIILPVSAQEAAPTPGQAEVQAAQQASFFVAPEVFERGLDALSAQQYEQAAVDFSLFILLNPTAGRGYLARGLAYQFLDQPDQALTDLGQALELDDTMPDFRANVYAARSDIFLNQGRVDEALSDLAEALAIRPDIDLYTTRAQLNLEQENYEAALVDLDAAIDLNADDPALFFWRGAVKSRLGSDTDAAGDFFEWVNGIQQSANELDPLQPGRSLALDFEPQLVYRIPFNVETGQVINIIVANLSGDADPLIVMLDPDGNPVVGNDDSSADNTSAVVAGYEAEAEGFYTLLVTHSIIGYQGRVVVLLELQDAA